MLTNFLDFTRIPSTCSDGPCSGIRNGVGYNYKGTGLGSESQNPDSCCDTISLLEGRQTGGSLAWYNPPLNTTIVAGNKTTSWAFDLITGLSLAPVPGTGNPCNRSLPLTICNFDNVVRRCSLLESTEQIGLAYHTPAQRSWHCCMQGHTARATIHYVLQGSQQHMCIKYVFHGAYKKTITVLLWYTWNFCYQSIYDPFTRANYNSHVIGWHKTLPYVLDLCMQPVTYCEGSDFTKGGCGENLVYNTTAANEVASEAKCCRVS